jgi:hypothetical protein
METCPYESPYSLFSSNWVKQFANNPAAPSRDGRRRRVPTATAWRQPLHGCRIAEGRVSHGTRCAVVLDVGCRQRCDGRVAEFDAPALFELGGEAGVDRFELSGVVAGKDDPAPDAVGGEPTSSPQASPGVLDLGQCPA